MDQIHNEYRLKSSTGLTDLFVQSVTPADDAAVIGVIQIVHGMAEHTDRYLDVARYLCNEGFAVFMHDHAGHGRSVKSDGDLGFFGEKDGNERLVDDVKDPAKVEKELWKLVPPEEGNMLCHRFVWHGRAVCVARRPQCDRCCLAEVCRYCRSHAKKKR